MRNLCVQVKFWREKQVMKALSPHQVSGSVDGEEIQLRIPCVSPALAPLEWP